jgi:carboxypeptidase C (cathepsin A)
MICRVSLVLALYCSVGVSAIDADEIKSFPGFDGAMPSKVYSGYIKSSAPTPDGVDQTFYSHYVLTESQGNPATDPLVLWQQGGPGSSGFGFGYFAELGPYVIDADSLTKNSSAIPRPFLNENSWDHLSNLLLFEHPPGTGFSYCVDKDEKPIACHWDDQSQAVAFYNTLTAFYDSYQDYAKHDLFIIGESYAGLLIPFLVDQIVKHPTETPAKQLKSFAVGNGCPGTSGSTTKKTGTCNGPYGNYDTQHVFELAWGHSGLSRKLHDEIVTACKFPCKAPTWSEDCKTFSPECEKLLSDFSRATGPFNIYNYLDNCGSGNQIEFAVGADGASESSNPNVGTFNELRERFSGGAAFGSSTSPAHRATGGQTYPCGTGHATTIWCNNAAVRQAINMKPESFYGYPWSLGSGPSTMA